MNYIKISHENTYVIVTLDEAKSELDALIESDDAEGYNFSCVEMTEDEFKNLPEFEGF